MERRESAGRYRVGSRESPGIAFRSGCRVVVSKLLTAVGSTPMYPRALLTGLVLASPAWSQEPVQPHFDLHSESVRNIVRDTAATQYAQVRIAEENDAQESEPFDSTSLEEIPLLGELPPKGPASPRAYVDPNGLFASVVDILVDSALSSLLGTEVGDDELYVACSPKPDPKATPLQFATHQPCVKSASEMLGLAR